VDALDIAGALLIIAFLVWNQMRSRPIVAQRLALIPVGLVICSWSWETPWRRRTQCY